MKYLSIITLAILLSSNAIDACSMYKITQDGKTIVGNNEDFFNANTEIWFVPKGNNLYGVMNVGFDNGFPQGAINEAGLMYDGFAMPYLKIKNTKGKNKIPAAQLSASIMHNYATVKEVKEYLSTVDLSGLETAMLVFVDSKGDYLVVEGELLILGKKAEQSFSNFYPSQTPNPEKVTIDFYQNGLKYLKTAQPEANFEHCSSVMNNMQQDLTQYTSIYDLEKRTIRLYHYQNFEDYFEIDLVAELNKGAHKLKIPELFPKNTEGYQYYEMYNDADAVVQYYETLWETDTSEVDSYAKKYLEKKITMALYHTATDWAHTKKDKTGAIKIYRLLPKLFPENKKIKKVVRKSIRRIS